MRARLYTITLIDYEAYNTYGDRQHLSTDHVRLTITQELGLSRRIRDLIDAKVLSSSSRIRAYKKPIETTYDDVLEIFKDRFEEIEERIVKGMSGHEKAERLRDLMVETRKRPRQRKKVKW